MKFKSHLYYEDKDNVQEAVSNLKPLQGSKIIFFKNGENQGEAFVDIYGGCYYPSVSLHKNVTVSINFGPNFKFPPSDVSFEYRGVCPIICSLIMILDFMFVNTIVRNRNTCLI